MLTPLRKGLTDRIANFILKDEIVRRYILPSSPGFVIKTLDFIRLFVFNKKYQEQYDNSQRRGTNRISIWLHRFFDQSHTKLIIILL